MGSGAMFKIPVDNEMYLRILSSRDASDLFNITTQSKTYLRQWLPWVDDILSVEDSNTFIKSALQLQQEQKALTMGVFYEDRLVGVVGFNALDFKNKIGFIGYWLHQGEQGKGIMTRAVQALISYGFSYYRLHRIDIRTAASNKASARIPERLGFQYEGRLRQAEWLYNYYVDHYVYGMLKEEWKN